MSRSASTTLASELQVSRHWRTPTFRARYPSTGSFSGKVVPRRVESRTKYSGTKLPAKAALGPPRGCSNSYGDADPNLGKDVRSGQMAERECERVKRPPHVLA